jgi:copper ion binding protein
MTVSAKESAMYELQVEGMSCNHCAQTVTRSVQSVASGAKVEVDLAAKKVRVDGAADLQAIAAAIEDAGYEVTASSTI